MTTNKISPTLFLDPILPFEAKSALLKPIPSQIMLAHALTRPYAEASLSNKLKLRRPSPPPNSPHLVNPKVINSEADEQDENDEIDFSRLRAELDRLLEESEQEPDDGDVNEGLDCTTIDVFHQVKRTGTILKIRSAERLSRSL